MSKYFPIKHKATYLLVIAFFSISFSTKNAKAAPSPNFSEGIYDEVDSKNRGPVISVGQVVTNGAVTLLIDTYSKSDETKKLPNKIELYINNTLITTKFKNANSTGPIHFPVDPKIATAPFNYTIHAQTLHQSRSFSSVYNGTTYNSNLSANLFCTISVVNSLVSGEDTTSLNTNEEGLTLSEDKLTYKEVTAEAKQISDTSFHLSFTAVADNQKDLLVFGNVTLSTVSINSDNATNAVLSLSSKKLKETLIGTSGTATYSESSELTALNLKANELELNCSNTENLNSSSATATPTSTTPTSSSNSNDEDTSTDSEDAGSSVEDVGEDVLE